MILDRTNISNEDNLSICSTTSKSNEKVICFMCKEEIQQKALFNHLRKKHNDEFLYNATEMRVSKALKKKKCLDLEIDIPNERDEFETTQILFYCILGTDYKTNKNFTTESRANDYLKKNPKEAKEHFKQLEEILKIIKKKNAIRTNYLRSSSKIQIALKLSYHFINYIKQPLHQLKAKNINIDNETNRLTFLNDTFLDIVNNLPTDSKASLDYEKQTKPILKLWSECDRFFSSVIEQVDRVYEYPVWLENAYMVCATKHNPEGRKYGDKWDYWNHLTYPLDNGILIQDE
jgi:hypothetical protein